MTPASALVERSTVISLTLRPSRTIFSSDWYLLMLRTRLSPCYSGGVSRRAAPLRLSSLRCGCPRFAAGRRSGAAFGVLTPLDFSNGIKLFPKARKVVGHPLEAFSKGLWCRSEGHRVNSRSRQLLRSSSTLTSEYLPMVTVGNMPLLIQPTMTPGGRPRRSAKR